MVKTAAMIFGIVFILIGILGFIPAFTPDNHLLGIFEVGGLHNIIHLVSGVAALIGSMSYSYSQTYFKVFGVVYGLVTVLGVLYMDKAILGIINHNVADIFLHGAITGAALYLGFGTQNVKRNEPTVV